MVSFIRPRLRYLLALLPFAAIALLAGCGGSGLAYDPTSGSAATIAVPEPVQTVLPPTWDVRTPYPPTPTEVYPPDYKTPTPIPPEHRMFFVGMGNGGSGVPGIAPRPGATPPITEDEVRAFVSTHPMQGDHISISEEPGVQITGIDLTALAEVYKRYGLQPTQPEAFPPSTSVYLVEMQGVFHFAGGPPPGDRGTYHTGVEVFDAQTGDILLEGGVGLIDGPPPPSSVVLPEPVQTVLPPTWDPRKPYPPTATPVLPPDYKTTTPIPPEHRSAFTGWNAGGAGQPAIEPRPGATPPITEDEVRAYASAHPMTGDGWTGINVTDAHISKIELITLADFYKRYYFLNLEVLNSPWSPSKQVYVVEMDALVQVFAGPPPGHTGTFRTGVEVFDAQTGDVLLEGGVHLIAESTPIK